MSQNSGKGSSSAAESGSTRLTVPAAREIVRQAIGKGGFSETISPAFPVRWPPEANGRVVYFVYTFSPLATSMNLRRVFSPYLRVELPVISPGRIQPDVRRMEAHQLEPSENAGADSVSTESLEKAAAVLFDTVGVPSAGAAEQIRRPYLAWLHDHPALAAELMESFPAFFAWLAEK